MQQQQQADKLRFANDLGLQYFSTVRFQWISKSWAMKLNYKQNNIELQRLTTSAEQLTFIFIFNIIVFYLYIEKPQRVKRKNCAIYSKLSKPQKAIHIKYSISECSEKVWKLYNHEIRRDLKTGATGIIVINQKVNHGVQNKVAIVTFSDR